MNRDGGLIHEFIHIFYDDRETKSPMKTWLWQIKAVIKYVENEIRRFVPDLDDKTCKRTGSGYRNDIFNGVQL